MQRSSLKYIAVLIGVLVLAADFVSKFLTQKYLPLMSMEMPYYPYGGIGLFKNFLGIEASISYTTNKGAAWGLFSSYQNILLALRICLVLVLLGYFIFNKQKLWDIPLALIIAGAVGNIIDYFIYGHVVDMLHVVLWGYDFPVFNIADSAIFIGISWLMLLSFYKPSWTLGT